MNLIPYRIESTPEQPIGFFFHFYREGGFMVYYRNFEEIEFEELSAAYFTIINADQRIYEFDVHDFEKDDLKTVRVSFEEKLINLLTDEVKRSIKMINQRISHCKTSEEKKILKGTLIESLHDLHQVINTRLTTARKYPVNFKAVDYLIDHVRKTYRSNSTAKKADRKPKNDFGFTGKIEILKGIYALCNEEFNFINERETTEKDFIEVLTTNDFTDIKKTVRFNCQTVTAMYILNRMSYMFDNLTDGTIEESGVFVTKNGSVLTAGNKRKSLTALNSKTVKKEAIKNVFQRLGLNNSNNQ